jgi:hypothetical protein
LYSFVWKRQDALWPSILKFALEYTLKKVQENQEAFEQSGIYQLLVYTDVVDVIGKNITTVKRDKNPMLDATKVNGTKITA